MIAVSRYVLDATADNFRALVLENSDKGPVLVNYWSVKAAPCFMLTPRLVRLACEYAGRFLLVMVNTDEHRRLAKEHGVDSLPTIQVFRHGQAVATLCGAEAEPVLRRFIDKHLARRYEGLPMRASNTVCAGNVAKAASRAAPAVLDNPDPNVPVDGANMSMVQPAGDLSAVLPPALRSEGEIAQLLVYVRFVVSAHTAPDPRELRLTLARDPGNSEARFQLASRAVTHDDYATALAQLFEIAQRDRGFLDGAAPVSMQALMNLLGDEHPLVRRYRPLLQQVLD